MNDTVGRLLAVFDDRADHPALVGSHGSTSYRELADQARCISTGIRDLGLGPGDRYTVSIPNGPDFVACYLAALWSGTTVVPMGKSLPTKLRSYIIQVVQPVVEIDEKTIPSLKTSGSPTPLEPLTAAGIFFTSGTTSRPKGVYHRLTSMLDNAEQFNDHVGLGPDVRMLHVMPMGNIAGFLNTVLCPLVAGGTVVLAPLFTAASGPSFWKHAVDHDANAMWITPTIAAFLVRMNRSTEIPQWTARNLRYVFVGTAPLPGQVATAFQETFGVPCLQSYGMTEILLVASNSPNDNDTQTVGSLIHNVDLRILDDRGSPVVVGDEGSLSVRSSATCDGYLSPDSGQPIDACDDDWFATGDVGCVDDSGRLVITGRTKDLIIRGGTNVSPTAVEDALLAHPEVVEVGVAGVPHHFWGQEVVAYVVLEANTSPNVTNLTAWCRDRLPTEAAPTQYRFVHSLPRSSSGKLQRYLLSSETRGTHR